MSPIQTRRAAIALAGLLAVASARADVVHLIPGSTFKQAQGGAALVVERRPPAVHRGARR